MLSLTSSASKVLFKQNLLNLIKKKKKKKKKNAVKQNVKEISVKISWFHSAIFIRIEGNKAYHGKFRNTWPLNVMN